MGYESKVIFKAVMDIMKTSKTLDEAMARVADVANADGVVVTPPSAGERKEKDAD